MNTAEITDNPLVEAYCDGAAMAYKDVAAKLRDMITKSPPELMPYMEAMGPFADSCDRKALNVFVEANQYFMAVRQ